MKKIEAIIKPAKLEAIKDALAEAGIEGMTVSEVKGYGKQQGHQEVYRGVSYQVEFVPKVKIEIVVSNEEFLKQAIEIIKDKAHTDKVGDGKIFVLDVLKTIRIRTGEEDTEAL